MSVSAHGRTVSLPKHRQTRCAKARISPAISTRFGSSSLAGKNIPLLISPKSAPSSRHPASSKRGVRVVTIRGVRGAVDAMALRARGIAGRPQALSWAVSDRSAQDERRCCVRQKRVVLAPVAGVKLAEAVRTQPGSLGRQSGSDGGKRNSSPGRARHKPSNHCAGKAGCSPLDLYARVRTSLCHCTRDRGCSAHPVFPAPSLFRGTRAVASARGARRLRAWRCVWACRGYSRSTFGDLSRVGWTISTVEQSAEYL